MNGELVTKNSQSINFKMKYAWIIIRNLVTQKSKINQICYHYYLQKCESAYSQPGHAHIGVALCDDTCHLDFIISHAYKLYISKHRKNLKHLHRRKTTNKNTKFNEIELNKGGNTEGKTQKRAGIVEQQVALNFYLMILKNVKELRQSLS